VLGLLYAAAAVVMLPVLTWRGRLDARHRGATTLT
jgi:hypothetical protein